MSEEANPGRSAKNTPNVMADLLSKSKVATATPCPNCKSYLAEGATICTHCGYSTQSGKNLNTRVYNAPKEKKAKASSGPSMSFDPMMGVWAMALIYGGLAVACFASPAALLGLMAVLVVHSIAVQIWLLVALIVDGDIIYILLALIPIAGPFIMLYYILCKTERTVMRAHWVMALIATIMTVLLSTSFAPLDEEDSADPLAFNQPVLPLRGLL